MTQRKSRARVAAKAVAALGWLKENGEPVKIIFLVVAAVWALIEYRDKQEETRTARVIEYVNQASERMAPVQLKTAEFWKDDPDAISAREISDKAKFETTIADLVEHKLKSEAEELFDYYNGLARCTNAGLCGARASCSLVGEEMKVFLENEGPYFERLSKVFKYDVLKSIRAMVARKPCRNSRSSDWFPWNW